MVTSISGGGGGPSSLQVCKKRSRATRKKILHGDGSAIYEGKAKNSWTFLITFIIDVRLFSYFHKRNNGLLPTFM